MKKAKAEAVVLLICAVWPLAGCQSEGARRKEQAEREYPAALKSLIGSYADARAANPSLPPASLPRAARRAILADRMIEVAKADARLAENLNALTPPSGQERIRATLVNLFASSSQGHSRWATALRSGDMKAADHESELIDQTEKKDEATLKALGVRFPAWSQGL